MGDGAGGILKRPREENEERDLYEKFVELKRNIIERAIQTCSNVFYFEIFVLTEGHVLSCGYISSAYQSLVDELHCFREEVNEAAESIKRIENEKKMLNTIGFPKN